MGSVEFNIKECSVHGQVKHRFINDKRKSPYYSCSICLEENSVRHRRKYWLRYLAQKANARKDKVKEKITEEMLNIIFNNQTRKCAISGQDLDVNSKWWKPSLDRIDANRGYYKDNIRIVAWIINHCKLDLPDDEFLNMCKKVCGI